MDIITGYLGEAHITAEQDRDINIGIVGDGSYVMPAGQRLAAEVSSNNEVRIRDGVIMHQGCAASIKKNTYDPVTIINGSQGMKRIDLIVARYERNVETGVETIDLVVLQGTPAEGSPETPEYTEGDIQSGDTVADMPLYEVQIDGLNITGVEKVFEEIESLKALNGNINGDILYENDLEYFAPTKSETTYNLSKPVSNYNRLLVQSINNNGVKMWTIADTTRGTGVAGTSVEYLFVLSYIVPISTGTSGADPGAWLQSTGFELVKGGSALKSGAGCQVRLTQTPSYERKHYIGITKVIGLE